jgi:hypothetical protein
MRSNGFGVIPCGDAPEAGSDARADIPSEQGRLSPKLRVLAVEDAPLDVELDCLASAISVPALRSGSSSTIRILVFSLCHREQGGPVLRRAASGWRGPLGYAQTYSTLNAPHTGQGERPRSR